MQGGLVHGLGTILWGQIPFKAGVSQVKNFSNYRVLRIGEMPQITTEIITSGTPTGGAGEPATPPIGPAVASAYFKLMKQRIRNLPMFPTASRMGD
jgi:isoquinoline 1-oxidoreductase beta subunit